MRISDWSSDVCSSDLSGGAAERMRNALLHEAGSGAGETPDYPITVVRPGEYRTRQIDAAKALFSATGVKRGDLAARQESFLGKIGRATCRERVCQYV